MKHICSCLAMPPHTLKALKIINKGVFNVFLNAKCNILLKRNAGCGPPYPRLLFQQGLFERWLCGAAPSQNHLVALRDPHTQLWGEDQQYMPSSAPETGKGRERCSNLRQSPASLVLPALPARKGSDELPWRRAAFPLEMGIAVGDTYRCGKGDKGTFGDLSAAAAGGGR